MGCRGDLVGVGRAGAVARHHHEHHPVGLVQVHPVGYDRDLVFLRICGHEGVAAVQQPAVIPELVVLISGHCRPSLQSGVAEPSLLILFLQADIQDLLAAPVLQPAGACGLGLPVDHPDLVHDRGGQVVEGRALVPEEEGASADGQFVDLLAVEFDFSVVCDLHSRHPLYEVLEHVVGPYLERRRVELDGVLFDDYGIADI